MTMLIWLGHKPTEVILSTQKSVSIRDYHRLGLWTSPLTKFLKASLAEEENSSPSEAKQILRSGLISVVAASVLKKGESQASYNVPVALRGIFLLGLLVFDLFLDCFWDHGG